MASVLNPGITNNSSPPIVIIFCSQINGWLSITPLISNTIYKNLSKNLRIFPNNFTPLG